jgi:hypothetical protein
LNGVKRCQQKRDSVLSGSDAVYIPGTELGEITSNDKFFIRNRHYGRCLGRDASNTLIHSPAGPTHAESIPCDINDPNFHWVSEEVSDPNKQRFRLINTNLCLALPEIQFGGAWANTSRTFTLADCDSQTEQAVSFEKIPIERTAIINDEPVQLDTNYALKIYSGSAREIGTCSELETVLSNDRTIMRKLRPFRCDDLSRTPLHFTFPKILE